MVKKVTPQIVNSYAKAFGVDTLLKTKPVKIYEPKAKAYFKTQSGTTDFYDVLTLPEEYNKGFIYIDSLISEEKGGGLFTIKKIVKESIKDGNEGRVALHAGVIDSDRGHPLLFYYKLGFRSNNRIMNKLAEVMMKSKNGGPRPNMLIKNTYFMYLPKENVEHCLNYKSPAFQLTYAPDASKTSHKVNFALVDAYKKACGVDNMLQTKKPDLMRLEPRIDVESWLIKSFSPIFSKTKYPKEYIESPVTYIEFLDSYEKGAGTSAVKSIVRKSLKDDSEGRVALNACIMDYGKGNPMGFYYKLGFRSVSDKYNKLCEEWLKNGGKMENRPWQIKYWPFAPKQMYLPKENIEHCLKYPEKTLKLAQ